MRQLALNPHKERLRSLSEVLSFQSTRVYIVCLTPHTNGHHGCWRNVSRKVRNDREEKLKDMAARDRHRSAERIRSLQRPPDQMKSRKCFGHRINTVSE